MLNRLRVELSRNFNGFFTARDGRPVRWVEWAWLAALFLAGAAIWVQFFNSGHLQLNFQDWTDVTGPRLDFLKDALMHRALPLHVTYSFPGDYLNDRYLSIPDAFVAPQAILLLFLSVEQFILANQILMYTLGFIGLMLFRRRFQLSPFAFTILFFLFNFNGHILSHYTIGHFTWGGYFLLPYFVLLVARLIDGDQSWRWVGETALLLVLVWLNGSYHQFVWSLIFLALLAITAWKTAVPIAKVAVFSFLIGLFRLLPPTLLLGKFSEVIHFIGGYPTILSPIEALVVIPSPTAVITGQRPTQLIGSWEITLYVGAIGAIFLAIFGLVRWLSGTEGGFGRRKLALPMLGLAALSIGDVFQVFWTLQIPMLSGERMTTRMILLPFVLLIFIAVVEFQRWLDTHRIAPYLYVGMLALLAVNLYAQKQFFNTWRISNVAWMFPQPGYDTLHFQAVARGDRPYWYAIRGGIEGSAAGLAVLACLIGLEWKGVLARMAARALDGLEPGTPLSKAARLRVFLIRVLAPESGTAVSSKTATRAGLAQD
jgi:hypothetical protein